ncbi:MAG: FtsX-like permease family protein [Roseivirga sp.]|nr:FtsX-like permease family protein [Roseivirga sp.]
MKSQDRKPPRLARKFFHWYCSADLKESIDGDLEERFYENLRDKGPFRAQTAYWMDVVRLMNRYTLKNKSGSGKAAALHTLRNNLIHSYRFLQRHKHYAFINLCGLSLGLAVTLIISFFIQKELSYDRFFEQSERVLRINNIYTDEQGNVFSLANSSPAFAREFQKSIPAYQKTTRMRYTMRAHLTHGDASFYEDKGYYADSLFLEVLPYELLAGDPSRALDEPNSILITEAMALKYFKSSKPIGKLLTFNGDHPLRVTGILAPLPDNSHLDFDFLISFSTYQVPADYASDLTSWSWAGFLTYALVAPDTDIPDLTDQTNQLIAAQFGPGGMQITAHLQPLHDIYLGSSRFPDDLNSGLRSGSQFSVYILTIIAVLILAISGFNYANLSASLSLQRGKEMGIRKVMGANNHSIRWQLFTDALMITTASLAFAYFLIWVAKDLPLLADWGMSYEFPQALRLLPQVFVASIGFALLISTYPALLFSKMPTASAIKNKLKNFKGGNLTRRALVSIQFCITLGLISAALVIKDQLHFISQQNLGIDKESVLTVRILPEDMNRHYSTLKSALEQNANIVQVTRNERLIGDPWPVNMVQLAGQTAAQAKQVVGNQVGLGYLETIGGSMKSGRFFSPDLPADLTNSIVINQATADLLELEDPVGKEVLFFSNNGPRRIIGVMEDFHFSSLHQEISPMVLIMPFIDLDNITIRVSKGNLSEKVATIEQVWNEVTQGLPLDIKFMNDQIEGLYRTDQQLSSQISYFSALAVFLACLGLYGLISFNTKRRLKEISIRKVIGANPLSLLRLLTQEYFLLLVVAAALAIPVSYLALRSWLDTFAYSIKLDPLYFLGAFLAFGAICFATISRQVLLVVRQNPVKHLMED